MSHSTEMSRPDHQIHQLHIPQGHAHLDQKTQKMGRSPMASQLPQMNGLESPEQEPGSSGGAGFGGM